MLVPFVSVKITLLSSILLFLLILPLAVHDARAVTPQLSFGSLGSGQGQLNTPRGIAVDNVGNIYVADNRNHRVEKFDSSGNYVSEFDKEGIPEGIAIYNGTVYVVDRNDTNVKEFTTDGRLLFSFGAPGTNTGQLSNPERIAIDNSGNIYVTDTGDIQKFNSKGASISQFLADGKYQCCLNVMGVAVDISGNVYAADMEFHKIIKFSPTGSTLAEFNATFSAPDISGTPQDVTVDNTGNIYVADTYDGRVIKLDPVGNPISELAISGVPVGLAIKGNQVYVVDIANSRVDMFLTSQFVNNYTSATPTDEQRKETDLNKNSTAIDAAIKFAEDSPQFQSMVEGYNYSFSSDFEESGPLSKGGIGLTAHGFAFELYLGPVTPGKAVKVVEVLEDPTFAKILNMTSYHATYMGPEISTPTNSTVSNVQNTTLLSPLEQFKSGIQASKVVCDQGFQLIFKRDDTSPACVKLDTAQKLFERGWGFMRGVQAFLPLGNTANTKTSNNPLGITTLVIYHPFLGCLSSNCAPNNFYLQINSNSTAYLTGYDICDKYLCVTNDTLSVLLPLHTILNPNYASIGLPANLKWNDGDTVTIKLNVSSTSNETGLLVDLGNSTIVP